MEVEVKLFGAQRQRVGKKRIIVEIEDGGRLRDVLAKLRSAYGELFEGLDKPDKGGILIICDGEPTQDLNVVLKEGIKILLAPIMSGG